MQLKTAFMFLLAIGVAVVMLAPVVAGPRVQYDLQVAVTGFVPAPPDESTIKYENKPVVRVYRGTRPDGVIQFETLTCDAASAALRDAGLPPQQAASCATAQRSYRTVSTSCNDPVSGFFQSLFGDDGTDEADDDADDDSDD